METDILLECYGRITLALVYLLISLTHAVHILPSDGKDLFLACGTFTTPSGKEICLP